MKIDGEKGEGPELMKKFGVDGYPTVILLNKEGKEIDRIVGFGGDRDEYLQQVRNYLAGKETLADFLNRFEANPQDVKLAFEIGRKYNLRNDEPTAATYFTKAKALDPSNANGFHEEIEYRLSSYALKEGNIEKIRSFIAGLSDDSRYLSRSYNSLLRYYRSQDQQNKVLETYEAAIQHMPESSSMMNGYAWYIFSKKLTDHYPRGIEVAQRAVEISPEADAIWDTLGQLHFANGNIPAAIEAMEKAAELNADEESYRENLKNYRDAQSQA